MSNKQVTHVSASSITLFENCPTRWYHRYLLGHKTKQTDAMARGSQVHEHLEKYLETGTLPDTDTVTGKIAAAGIEHLPAPNKDAGVEVDLKDYAMDGLPVPFKGFIDLLETEDEIHILDHKTTSAWKWAKTEEELRTNMQLIIYARHVLDHHPDATEARLTHVYYLTRPPHGSRKVSVVVDRQHVEDEFNKILLTVNKMLETAQDTLVNADKNKSFCYSYGKRCPHYNDCWYTFERTETLPMSNKQEDVLALLRGDSKKKTSKKAKAEKPAPAPTQPEVINEAVTIYFGCRPMYGETISLVDHLEPMMKEIAAAEGVSHISFIPYAKGWDLLAQKLSETGLAHGAYYVPSMSQVAQRVSDALISAADQVVIAG